MISTIIVQPTDMQSVISYWYASLSSLSSPFFSKKFSNSSIVFWSFLLFIFCHVWNRLPLFMIFYEIGPSRHMCDIKLCCVSFEILHNLVCFLCETHAYDPYVQPIACHTIHVFWLVLFTLDRDLLDTESEIFKFVYR